MAHNGYGYFDLETYRRGCEVDADTYYQNRKARKKKRTAKKRKPKKP